MDVTVQLVTHNNAKTIQQTLESLGPLRAKILIADLDSSDDTPSYCGKARVLRLHDTNAAHARNQLSKITDTEWSLWLQPWEILTEYDKLKSASAQSYRLPVIQEGVITWEPRLWHKSAQLEFVNPVFERLNVSFSRYIESAIGQNGGRDWGFTLTVLDQWRKNLIDPEPCYYHACSMLALGRYPEFLHSATQYLFLDKRIHPATVMTRYYYAMILLWQEQKVRPTLQNLTLCLCAKPLMAEFWCLTGDVYYHLLNDFDNAIEFYENAIILGSRRLANDNWPMDVAKYSEYPERMIASCRKLIANSSKYVSTNRRDGSR